MKCDEVRELMMDAVTGEGVIDPRMTEHLGGCPACASKLDDMRKTMALLDEWQAPEPSPYFDTRLQARLREEAAKPVAGWLHWFRNPALAVSLALMMMVAGGVSFFTGKPESRDKGMMAVSAPPGTAVGDLEQLEKNHDLYADFDVLDDLQVQQDVAANP
jgi:predicted anti-sigma-YlaC factor YlaD